MQFAARFELSIDPATVALCGSIPLDDLPAERVWGEMEKLLLAPRPSIGLAAGLEIGVMEKLFPELRALVGCTQEPDVHPEGDVWVHTLQAVDVAAAENGDLGVPRRLAVLLATLCHDLGKPATWKRFDGRVRFHGHEAESVEPARRLLDRLNVRTRDGFDVRGNVLRLVEHHLAPSQFHRDRARIGDAAFRRLSLKCDLDLLVRVARADLLGRRAPAFAEASAGKAGGKVPSAAACDWFASRAKDLGVAAAPPAPILLGRHVLDLGVPPGPRVGEITEKVYQRQLDGEVRTLEEAIAAARNLLAR
jgi:tRNA nucleotidyltransferase (CCA-adding enzyme)